MQRLGPAFLMISGAALASSVYAAENQDTPKTEDAAEIAPPLLDPTVVAFVERHCSDCHNDFQEEGDRSFDAFLASPNDDAHHFTVEEMLHEINRGAMPKARDGIALPSDDERRSVVASLTAYLDAVAALSEPEETPLRRLTNIEYRNTIRDLLGIEGAAIESLASFPADSNIHGLTNLARAQNLSRQQLEAYVNAAMEALDVAFDRLHTPQVEAQRLIVEPRALARHQTPSEVTRQTWTLLGRDNAYLDIGYGSVEGRRPIMPRPYIRQGGAPADGIYSIRIDAEALYRTANAYDPAIIRYDAAREPIKMAVGYAPAPDKIEVVHAPERPVLEVFDLVDDERKVYEVQTMLQKGSVPMLYWVNSPPGGSAYVTRVIDAYYPKLGKYIGDLSKGEFVPFGRRNLPGDMHTFLRDEFQGARIRVHSMEIIGPFTPQIEGALTLADLRRYIDTPQGELGSVFSEFASRAFRRPVAEPEIRSYLALANRRLATGASQEEAIKLGFAAILSSPRFLFLDEGSSADGRALAPYELASRLSYFLWSTMPDAELMQLAATGELTRPDVIEGQIKRMLRDQRANNFVSGFVNSWLRLDKLGTMPPDRRVHRRYFSDRLETAMRKETELVFTEFLLANHDPARFLDTDFTYVNGGLARHYGMDGILEERFQRVSLPDDSVRRGLIGHSSILTASANGIDTSPVIRGVWVLENLLGSPPPAPPPDVPAIEPDQRGATTVRELLEKHRSVQACADCHASIDPYGFPLEVFGPTGERRRAYPAEINGTLRLNRGLPIDSSTQLPSGEQITNMLQFKSHLMSRERDFEKHLVSKLLSYGTGREPVYRDQAEIERILSELDSQNGGFQDMIVKVATSEYFLSR